MTHPLKFLTAFYACREMLVMGYRRSWYVVPVFRHLIERLSQKILCHSKIWVFSQDDFPVKCDISIRSPNFTSLRQLYSVDWYTSCGYRRRSVWVVHLPQKPRNLKKITPKPKLHLYGETRPLMDEILHVILKSRSNANNLLRSFQPFFCDGPKIAFRPIYTCCLRSPEDGKSHRTYVWNINYVGANFTTRTHCTTCYTMSCAPCSRSDATRRGLTQQVRQWSDNNSVGGETTDRHLDIRSVDSPPTYLFVGGVAADELSQQAVQPSCSGFLLFPCSSTIRWRQ